MKGERLQPFDQFNNAPGGEPGTARALAFPHLVAGVVNGKTRLFARWVERTRGRRIRRRRPSGGRSRPAVPRHDLGVVETARTGRRAVPSTPAPRVENALQPGVGGPIVGRPSGPQVQPAAQHQRHGESAADGGLLRSARGAPGAVPERTSSAASSGRWTCASARDRPEHASAHRAVGPGVAVRAPGQHP